MLLPAWTEAPLPATVLLNVWLLEVLKTSVPPLIVVTPE